MKTVVEWIPSDIDIQEGNGSQSRSCEADVDVWVQSIDDCSDAVPLFFGAFPDDKEVIDVTFVVEDLWLLGNETVNDMTTDLGEMRHMLESLQACVESGGSRLRAERIDVAVMTQTLVDTAADDGRDATFGGLESLEIMARPVSLRRALANLIENALHYAGNVHVTVRRDGDVAEITFEDNGPGIPADRMEDVLQPFVRLDTARGRDTPGMGLGLPIVTRAIALENGVLQLRNREQGGLCVTVRLPCAAG